MEHKDENTLDWMDLQATLRAGTAARDRRFEPRKRRQRRLEQQRRAYRRSIIVAVAFALLAVLILVPLSVWWWPTSRYASSTVTHFQLAVDACIRSYG